MNKFLVLVSFFCWATGSAQPVTLNPYNGAYLSVRSYNGAIVNNLVNVQINNNASNESQMNSWSLTYRVNGLISNGNKNFPPDKLRLKFNSLETTLPYANNIEPNIQNIGIQTSAHPLSIGNTYFVQSSNYNLEVTGYFGLTLKYNGEALGGAYLADYSSWDNYLVNLIIEIRNSKGQLMASQPMQFSMQVHPDDTPPTIPTYGIGFDPTANNVLLELKSAADYANGVSKTFSKAFSTFSNTTYVIRVNSLSNSLTSATNSQLPVSSIKLKVKENQTQAVTGNINLSSASQNVVTSAAHSVKKFFDTTYSTQAGDLNFFNKSYQQYTGTLIYSIIPQ